MSDYSRQQDFSAKTGTTIFGSEVDSEFDALVTAVNSKVDESREAAANGIATLGAGALIPVGISGNATSGGGQIPEATDAALGAVELATSAEATTLTDASRVLTPDTMDDILLNGAGVLKDLFGLADPGADRILFWDESAPDATTWLTVTNGLEINATDLRIANSIAGTGLAESSGVISLSHLGLESLVDPNNDRILFWDDGAGNTAWLTVTDGLGITTTNLGLNDVSAGAAQPVVITNGTFTFDLSSITTMAISDVNVAQDGVVMSDNGTIKVLPLDEAGVDVITSSSAQTFTAADANTFQLLTGASAITWDIPPNGTTAFEIGTTILVGSRDTATLTISPNTSAVRLTSAIRSDVGPTAGDHTVTAGGMALLVKVATDEWMISGDIG